MSTLINRNVVVDGHRTSMRLEPAMWAGFEEIARREQLTLHQLCGRIDRSRASSSLTAAVRVFIMTYFRRAATEEGHRLAGHGPHRQLGGGWPILARPAPFQPAAPAVAPVPEDAGQLPAEPRRAAGAA